MIVNMVERNPAWTLRLVQKLAEVYSGKKVLGEVGQHGDEGDVRSQVGGVGNRICEDIFSCDIEHCVIWS